MGNFGAGNDTKRLGSEWLGRQVPIIIDRPLGSAHSGRPDLVYPLNYGYIPGTVAGDGEPIDVYLMGEPHLLEGTLVFIVGIIHRHNDSEDKLVGCREARHVTPQEIMQAVSFTEQWFDVTIETISGEARYEGLSFDK
jgi:inorganic pyrophosphatase